MTGWWRALQDGHPEDIASRTTAKSEIDRLIDAAFQESARADAKSATLLTIVGIGFTAFVAGCASAVVVPLRGPAQWLSVTALAGVCTVAELLLLALRPRLGSGLAGQRYFAAWRRYAQSPGVLATELSAEPDMCQMLIQLSCIVWRKYLLIRLSVDLLMVIIPVVAVAVSVALLMRLSAAFRSSGPVSSPGSSADIVATVDVQLGADDNHCAVAGEVGDADGLRSTRPCLRPRRAR